jgi:hypothetical protein
VNTEPSQAVPRSGVSKIRQPQAIPDYSRYSADFRSASNDTHRENSALHSSAYQSIPSDKHSELQSPKLQNEYYQGRRMLQPQANVAQVHHNYHHARQYGLQIDAHAVPMSPIHTPNMEKKPHLSQKAFYNTRSPQETNQSLGPTSQHQIMMQERSYYHGRGEMF